MARISKVFVLYLLSGLPAIAAGTDFSKIDLHPLLQIHGKRVTVADPSFPGVPVAGGRFEEQIFISRGGGTIYIEVDQGVLSPAQTVLIRGVAAKESLAKLNSELSAARIGFLTTCAQSGVVEGVFETTGPYEITWYGKGLRRNAFTVLFFGKADAPAEPLCPPEVGALLDAIRELVFAVAHEPGSENLGSSGQ